MITAADFKKQISKTLAGHLRSLGFKGSGFNYTTSGDNFIFSIGVQASRWDGRCCAELGIHPKEIDSFGNHKIDLKNLKYYSCEFRQRLWRKDPADQWWQYSDDPELNIQVAEHIFHSIKEQALPIIQLFKTEPYILDSIEVSDLSYGWLFGRYRHIPVQKSDGTYCVTSIKHVLKHQTKEHW